MKKILLVDDSSTLRQIVIKSLDSLDVQITGVESGEEALIALGIDEQFDLILLDWFMEGISGYDLFMKLKGDDNFRDIPVIMLTSADDKEKMLQAIRSGIKHYLTKPFTPEDLIIRVMQVLNLD